MANSRTGAFVSGIFLGTAVGTAIGLLMAPRSGRENRRVVQKSLQGFPEVAEDVSHSVQQQTERLLDAAQKSLDETMLRLQEAIAIGKQAMEERRQELQLQLHKAELGPDQEALEFRVEPTLAAEEPQVQPMHD